MSRLPISAVIIVKNGARYLARVLTPLLDLCDDVVVLDSHSTDETVAIAEKAGARVEQHAFLGYGPQKRLAVSMAKNDWILSVDADEVLDEALCAAIRALELKNSQTAYEVLRRNHIGNCEIRHGVWSPDWCLRLFNRTATNFSKEKIHESVMKTTTTVQLSGSMLHYSYLDCADVFARMGSYMRAKAERYVAEGRRASILLLLLRAAWGFTRSYLFKKGYRDGALGIVVALSVAVDAVAGLAIAGEHLNAPRE